MRLPRLVVIATLSLAPVAALAQGAVAPGRVPSRPAGDNSTTPANTAYVDAAALAVLNVVGTRAPLVSPTFSGVLTHTGTTFSLGGGAFRSTSQPDNAHLDMVAPNDRYHDNVLTIENRSINPANGACGNAAIRFRAINGYEKGAIRYSHLGSDARCRTGFFTNSLYMEGGNLGPDGNADDTDLIWVMTHVPGSRYFPGTQYRIFWAEASTGIMRMVNSRGATTHVYEPELFQTTFNGSANHLRLRGAGSGSAPEIAAVGTPGSDINVDLGLRTLGTGRVLINGTPLSVAATTAIGTSGATLPLLNTANTWAGQQSFGGGVTVAGAVSLLAGLSVNGALVSPQYAFTPSGNAQLADNGSNGINIRVGTAGDFRFFTLGSDGKMSVPATMTSGGYAVGASVGVSCSGAPTAAFQVINGIVTRC